MQKNDGHRAPKGSEALRGLNRLPKPLGGRSLESNARDVLLDLDFRADFVEFLPDGFGLFLVHTLLDALGTASTRSLASLRPRLVTSRTTLMMLIFLSAGKLTSVTLNSVFSSAGAAAAAAAAAAGHGHRHRRRRRDAELGFQRLHELRELEHADALDVIDHLLLIQFGHFCSSFFQLSRGPTPATCAFAPRLRSRSAMLRDAHLLSAALVAS